MPEHAKLIELKRKGRSGRVLLDGVELGALIAREPIQVTSDVDGMPTIRLTLMADRITVDDDSIGPPTERLTAPAAAAEAKTARQQAVAARVLGGA